MAALVQAFSRLFADTDVATESLKMLATLSVAGLLSILFAIYGPALDFPGFF
jgi:hypothetical protein